MAMVTTIFMDDVPIETSIYIGVPIAMFDERRVNSNVKLAIGIYTGQTDALGRDKLPLSRCHERTFA